MRRAHLKKVSMSDGYTRMGTETAWRAMSDAQQPATDREHLVALATTNQSY